MSKNKTVFLIYSSIITETQQKASEKQICISGGSGGYEGVKVLSQEKYVFKGEGKFSEGEEERRGLL